MLPATNDSQMTTPPPSNPLVGSWLLARWEVTYGDGRPASKPFGPNATGLIVYAPDFWMNASMAQPPREKLTSESAKTAPAAERLAAFGSFFSYGGRYRLVREDGIDYVIHSVTQSLNPNLVGTEQKRRMSFDAGGTLTLAADDTVPGSTVARHHRLIWERAR